VVLWEPTFCRGDHWCIIRGILSQKRSIETKNALTKLTLKEPIGFKMMMSSLGVNILEGKEDN